VLDTGTARGEDAAFEDAVALAASFVYTIDTHECLLDLLFVGPGIDEGRTADGGGVRAYTAGRGQMQSEHMLEVLAAVSPSEPAAFAELARSVLARRAHLSSVILILLDWDEARRALVSSLRAAGAEVRVLLVRPDGDAPPALPAGILRLAPGNIAQGLAALR
jgi:uncharacterized protein (DUF58 family)